MSFVVRLLASALSLYLLAQVYSGVTFAPGTGIGGIVVAALVLGVVNALVRPLLMLLSLPVNVLTLGLFTFVINGVVLWLAAQVTALDVSGFGAAMLGAILLTVISWVVDAVLGVLGLNGEKQ